MPRGIVRWANRFRVAWVRRSLTRAGGRRTRVRLRLTHATQAGPSRPDILSRRLYQADPSGPRRVGFSHHGAPPGTGGVLPAKPTGWWAKPAPRVGPVGAAHRP